MATSKKQLSSEEKEALIAVLKTRFEKNLNRHSEIDWSIVAEKLEQNPQKLWSLNEMESTDGEPDVVGFDSETGEYIFFDCSPESPKGRRSICFDQDALESRKENKPKNSAWGMAADMGVDLLTEEQYREFKRSDSSIVKRPVGFKRLRISGTLAVPFSVTDATTIFLYTIMAQNLIMPPGAFVVF